MTSMDYCVIIQLAYLTAPVQVPLLFHRLVLGARFSQKKRQSTLGSVDCGVIRETKKVVHHETKTRVRPIFHPRMEVETVIKCTFVRHKPSRGGNYGNKIENSSLIKSTLS